MKIFIIVLIIVNVLFLLYFFLFFKDEALKNCLEYIEKNPMTLL